MLKARGADEYRIAMFTFHKTVVGHPTNGDFRHCQTSLVRSSLDYLQCLEVRLIPIPFPIALLYELAIMK